MTAWPEGNAIVYCEGAFGSTNGKTAHGLVRRSRRYRVVSVIDSRHAGKDAGEVLDGRAAGIPIHASVVRAARASEARGAPATHLVIGLAPDGGKLPPDAHRDIRKAIALGLHVDSGLHDFLSEDEQIAQMARERQVTIRDVRKPPPRSSLHFFSGKIREVRCPKVAVLGTDSAVGKRTTAWIIVDGMEKRGLRAELIGTGQTAWMQGARYGIILDSLVNDFVAGEIEHVVWTAWQEQRPDVLVIEGQGSLLHPAYPGGFEILAAARPDVVVLQHAPARKEYDGFPGCPLHPLEHQIRAIETISPAAVVAVTLNHEGLAPDDVESTRKRIAAETGLAVFDVLAGGGQGLCELLSTSIIQHSAALSVGAVPAADIR